MIEWKMIEMVRRRNNLYVCDVSMQQRPNSDGLPKYRDSYHAFKETLRQVFQFGILKFFVYQVGVTGLVPLSCFFSLCI